MINQQNPEGGLLIGSTKDGLLVRAADYENLVKQQDYISIQILLGDPVVEGVFWRLPFVAILKTTFRSVSGKMTLWLIAPDLFDTVEKHSLCTFCHLPPHFLGPVPSDASGIGKVLALLFDVPHGVEFWSSKRASDVYIIYISLQSTGADFLPGIYTEDYKYVLVATHQCCFSKF
uniref:Uncharacterized protein n=1 Tax=Physcomitrium patens TaxID=3218 RepID=A0A7I3Z719_PHYPA